ncbi:MAG: glycosyltransferase family 39 protein, partial [Turicibacter sp.]
SMGIGNFYTALMLVNMSAVLLALASLYAFIYRRYGIQRATLFSLFSILITPLYSYSTIIYTDTLSMLFPILGVLLYDIYYHCKSKSRYGVLVLLGLVLTLGTLMKTNVIILVVGIFIHYFMTQKSVKALGTIAIVGGILFGLNSAYHKAIEPYIPIPMEDMGYPMTHWIMMGLKGNGGYNGDDDAFTMFLKDDYHLAQEDITKEHITVIKERLNEFGFGGFMNHLKNKINFTWSDGTYYAPDKLMKHPLPESDFGEYVFGERNQFFVYLSQVSHLILLFFILQSGFKLFRQNGFESVMTITLFGVFLFLIIWETRSRYVVLFIPMMIALASFGFDEFVAKVSKRLNVKNKK